MNVVLVLWIVAAAPPDAKDEAQSLTEFKQLVDRAMVEVEAKYAAFPGKDPKGEQVFGCKKAIRALLEKCDSADKTQVLADRFAAALCKSDRFQFYDYYVLWLGHRVLQSSPPKDKQWVLQLATKIDRRGEVKLHKDIQHELCAFCIEMLQSVVVPRARVEVGGGEINWKQWEEFSKWLSEHREKLQFDGKRKVFVASSADKP
jgi:hypothetical protein